MAPNPKDSRVTSVDPMVNSLASIRLYLDSSSKADISTLEPPDEARWIRLQKISYTDPIGRSRTWESAERQTRPTSSRTDGVGVVAILSQPDGPSLLLQKQFRPPLNTVTIEVPSGLIDPNETPSECALRELKEETGYIATIPTTPQPPTSSTNASDPAESFVMCNDPGFCNTNTQMVTVHVDMADLRNQPDALRPELEENEFIESFSLPLETLWEDLRRLEAEEGVAVDARVGTLAMGIEVAKRFGLGGGLGEEKMKEEKAGEGEGEVRN